MTRTFSITRDDVEHTWNVEELWAMQLPSRVFPLSDFDKCLAWDVWGEPLTPRSLLSHYKRMLAADLFYPIIVCVDEDGEVKHLVDGMHRLVKAYAKEYEKISVVVIAEGVLYEIPHKVNYKFCAACGCVPCDCNWGDY